MSTYLSTLSVTILSLSRLGSKGSELDHVHLWSPISDFRYIPLVIGRAPRRRRSGGPLTTFVSTFGTHAGLEEGRKHVTA